VKPEFYSHEELQDMEIEHPELHPMLVFSALWTQCEYTGVFAWSIRKLRLSILPFLDYDLSRSIDYLEGHNFIKKFSRNGKDYGFVCNFTKYQAISGKEKEGRLKYPVPAEAELHGSGQGRDYTGTIPEPDRDRTGSPDFDFDSDIGHKTKTSNSTGAAENAPPLASAPASPPPPGGENNSFKTKPEKAKKPPLREREPVNDFERVEKAYLRNWDLLYAGGGVKTPDPIVNWNQTRNLLKRHFVKLKPEEIIGALDAGMSDAFVTGGAYSLGTMLSAAVLNRLVNAKPEAAPENKPVGVKL
jgi:hypothetical protein